jgi:serine/threonine protein kinase
VLKISIGEERIPDTKNEYEILKNLDYYSIPKAEDLIIDYNFLYSIICMEYSDIDLNVLQYVQEHGCLDDIKLVKLAMKELFKALKYIHSFDYAHRDVKPDNVLIKVIPEEEGKEKEVKIILVDYNIAKKAKSFRSKQTEEDKESSESIRFRCNYLTHIASQNSQAPELFKSGYYSESVDIWGAGLVFYTLITGQKINRGDEEIIKQQVNDIANLSQSGKDLLLQMFSFDGESRPTANEALLNPWFSD